MCQHGASGCSQMSCLPVSLFWLSAVPLPPTDQSVPLVLRWNSRPSSHDNRTTWISSSELWMERCDHSEPKWPCSSDFLFFVVFSQLRHTFYIVDEGESWKQNVDNLCLTFQAISFPGLDESEVAHFLCGLQRLNKIAEVQTWLHQSDKWLHFILKVHYSVFGRKLIHINA